ncbi:hypothetical protein [Streptomyces decoyicus]|uniref:hypothetical protein n=1 Tax=Streptomyces decoyicus TaxID=249567 RepID=UPI003803CD8E
MSFHQVVRSVGFSIGSALGGLTLAAHTPAGSTFPTDTGYATASWLGAAAMGATVVAALALRQAPDSTTTGLQRESGLRKG